MRRVASSHSSLLLDVTRGALGEDSSMLRGASGVLGGWKEAALNPAAAEAPMAAAAEVRWCVEEGLPRDSVRSGCDASWTAIEAATIPLAERLGSECWG